MKKFFTNQYSQILYFTTLLLLAIPAQASAQFKYEVKTLITPTSFEGLLVAILNVFIVIAVPIIVLFIIYAGFLYVTARGNAEQVQQATRALTYSIIGGVIIIGAVAISQIIKSTVDAFTV